MIRGINDMKLRTKLVLSFIFAAFVPVLIVGVFLTGELQNMALDNALEQTANNVDRVKKRTGEVINVSYDISYRMSNDSRLETLANRHYESVYEVVKAYKDYPDIKDYIRLYKDISNIRLYVNNRTLLNNWEFLQPTKATIDSDWYQRALTSSGLAAWYYMKDERDNRYYLSLVRKIDFLTQHTSGVLVINVSSDKLNGILSQEPFETMIVDGNDRIVAANRPGRIGSTLASISYDPKVIAAKSGSFKALVDGKSSQIQIEPLVPESSLNDLRIISVFSYDDIMKEPNRIIRLALTVILVSLAVAIMLVYGFSAMLSKRMMRLSKYMTKVGTGNLDVALEIDGKDEIGQLSRQFNGMVASINGLIVELQDSNRQKVELQSRQNEIKFKMMASQINPHFLFNALESIRMKAHLKGERDISNVVRLLGKMMRKNLEAGSRTVLLRHEIDLVRCYLDIQKFRYEDRLRYELRIDPDVQDVPILPLIVQPLVENAVIHGLENREAGGCVRITAAAGGGRIEIEVADDGEGMPREKLDALNRSLDETEEREGNRIGLRNVHMRLKLMYGQDCGLRIRSEAGVGTSVHFSIPMEAKDDV
ncbi:two-component system, sensor histidine kinase YesM [Paenibacillus sp. UNC496MF]|uniref:sensor histidine kinase n=1 Tax=Paenibacillus sp. UNC496MF TaxID=1502753 RepID=UPI0008F430B0|nr:sensor histidine kinase [Paenibacillus sp. UNC496MF]SFJ68167.1 two-component system, sensor histidine kinase YesM [Paenibacillus sp. UNC496MF]